MITIIGRHGFIGSALAKRYDPKYIKSFPTKDTKVLFHFGSPVHPPFEENPDYHMNEIIQSFLYLLPYCRDNNILFVYPSSALVYEKETNFTRCKKIMELMASCYPYTLGLRIFPIYGPGENRTVIAKWCRQMKKGIAPLSVYGDGTQKRNFIYIDDAIDQIIELANNKTTGIRDVGSAEKPISFNDIIKLINMELKTNLKPKYIPKPEGYSKGIVCENPGETRFELKEGIKEVCQKI